MAHPGGRPPKLTPEQRQEVYEAFSNWIDNTADPLFAGFTTKDPVALKYLVNKDNLNDWEEFSALRKRAVEKQEYYLAEGGVNGRLNPSVAIFRLKQKQIGYTDRTETDITSGGDKLGVTLSAEQAEQLIRARANRSDT